MATSVRDFIIDRLIEWDLHQWYGYPGDGIGGFDGAMGRAQDDGKDFTYIRPTHEEEAAFWPPPTQNSPAKSASASRRPARVHYI